MAATLDDQRIHVRFKLSALWASLMFCYVYGDYFELYTPGKIAELAAGRMGPLGQASEGVLLGVSAMMAIPSLMVFLSLALPARASRWLNLLMGAVYTLVMLLTMPGARPYYLFFGAIEVALTLCAAWLAWRWPRQA